MAGNTRSLVVLAPSPQQHPQEHEGHILRNMAMGQPSDCGNKPHIWHTGSLQEALPEPCSEPAQGKCEGASLAQPAPKVTLIAPQTPLRWAPLLIQIKGQQISSGFLCGQTLKSQCVYTGGSARCHQGVRNSLLTPLKSLAGKAEAQANFSAVPSRKTMTAKAIARLPSRTFLPKVWEGACIKAP